MENLETLKESERILAANYWENFKYEKEMVQSLGGNHQKIIHLNNELKKIRDEWNDIILKIKEINNV